MSTSVAEAIVRLVSRHPEILGGEPPDADVMEVRGLVVDFSDLPLSPEYQDLPLCGERCKECIFYLAGKCDSIRQGFCENFIEEE